MSQVHCECDEKKFKELNRTYCATREGPYDTPNEIKSSVYTGSKNQISLNYAASFVFTVMVAFVMCLLFLLRPKTNKKDDKDDDYENENENENTIRFNSNHGNKIKEASAFQDVEREIAA